MRTSACCSPGGSSAALVLSLVVVGCGADEPPPEVARLVTVATAATDEAVETLTVLGDVHGEREVQLFADVPEKVVTVHVAEGDAVTAGAPIVTMDPKLLATDLAQAEAAEEVARATRDQLRAELERLRGLVGRGAAASAQLESLETQVRGADAQVAQLAAAQRAAGRRRARSTLRAPFAGVIARLSVEEGDLAAPQAPVALLVQMERVEIRLRVAERDFVRIVDGADVVVRPPSRPGFSRDGTVVARSPVVDRLTRTGTVEVRVENADGALLPGMVAEVDVVLERRGDVLMVPVEAVVMTPSTADTGEAEVFVVNETGDRARRREVRIGRRYGPGLEVTEGLRSGERVVVRGQHLLRDRSLVEVATPIEAPTPEET